MIIVKHKDLLIKENKDNSNLIRLKIASYLIELKYLILSEFKKNILSKKDQIYFYGHDLKQDSLINLVYRFTSINFSEKLIEKKDSLIEGVNKKIKECNCLKDFSDDEIKHMKNLKSYQGQIIIV